jgi:hypothetical protein
MATPQKQPAPKEDDGLVVHVHNQTPEEVAEFWTFERLNAAKPVPMPNVVAPPPTGGAEQTPKKGKKS